MIEQKFLTGSYLQSKRKEKGLTQEKVAERMNEPRQEVSRIERLDRVTYKKAKQYAKAIGVPTYIVFGGDFLTV